MRKNLLFFTLFLMALLGSFEQASACSCIPIAPCQAFQRSDVVFAGTAVGAKKMNEFRDYDEESSKSPTMIFGTEEIYFEVEEGFKGIETNSKITIVSNGGTTCDSAFEIGKRFVVYAKKHEGKLTTSSCSGNRSLKSAAGFYDYPQNLSGETPETKIVGRVDEGIKDYALENLTQKPMSDIKIKAQQIDGKRQSYFSTTDKKGYFEIKVPAGTYKVTPILAPFLDYSSRFSSLNRPVKLNNKECDSRDFFITNKSVVSGQVLDNRMKPVKNFTVHLTSATTSRGDDYFDYEFAVTDANGRFSFPGIPLGQYLLSVNYATMPDDESPYPTAFYPKTSFLEKAKTLKIDFGTQINRLIFKLPPKLPKIKFAGSVFWKDGTPAKGAEINLIDFEFDRNVYFRDLTADENGKFYFEAFIGRKYKIKAVFWKETKSKQMKIGIAQTESETFTLTEKIKDIKLILESSQDYEEMKSIGAK